MWLSYRRQPPRGYPQIVVFYVTDGSLPIEALGNWNIVVGFGFIAAGFGVSTQWK